MKKYLPLVLLLALTIGLAQAADTPKMAYVDVKYVVSNSDFIQEAYAAAAQEKSRVQKLIAVADQEIAEMQKKEKPEVVSKRKAEVQKILDAKVIALQNLQVDLDKSVSVAFQKAVADTAKAKALDLVFDGSVVRTTDPKVLNISNDVLELVEKSAK